MLIFPQDGSFEERPPRHFSSFGCVSRSRSRRVLLGYGSALSSHLCKRWNLPSGLLRVKRQDFLGSSASLASASASDPDSVSVSDSYSDSYSEFLSELSSYLSGGPLRPSVHPNGHRPSILRCRRDGLPFPFAAFGLYIACRILILGMVVEFGLPVHIDRLLPRLRDSRLQRMSPLGQRGCISHGNTLSSNTF